MSENADDASRRKQVVIFGAGIAGLTAAHELVERGFEVDVYEKEGPSPWDEVTTGARCAIGGMARTQWACTTHRFERRQGKAAPMRSTEKIVMIDDLRIVPPPHGGVAPSSAQQPEEFCRFLENALQMDEGERGTRPAAAPLPSKGGLWRSLKRVAERLNDLPDDATVEVRGFCDKPVGPRAWDYDVEQLDEDQRDPEKARKLLADRPDLFFAWKVASTLRKQLGCKRKLRVRAMGLGRREDWTRPAKDRNYVRFTIHEDWLPGEHGFRFFPAFYRHLFDTMKRTPIANETLQYRKGSVYQESPRTVLDNIIPTELMGMTTARHGKPFGFRRRAVASLDEVFEQGVGMLKSMGFPLSDLSRFQLKLFQYMTSCAARRKATHENQTWWQFLEAERFSKSFQTYLDSTAEALVAMNAKKSDARTYGNVSVQMLQDQLSMGDRVDGTLNGPTSVAWFDHWRRYLQHQGVTFHQGTLEGFEWHDRTPWAVVTRASGMVRVIGRDYYVLALPVKEMQRIAADVKGQIETARESAADGARNRDVPDELCEDFRRVCAMHWGDPTQADPGGSLDHMVGIQYYFDGDLKILNGHLLYPDTPWRLSAVGQPQFWRAKRGWWSGYRGILSVDISNWHNAGEGARPGRAWDMTKREIAEKTWEQICWGGGPPLAGNAARNPEGFPVPVAYHIDENIEWNEAGRPKENRSPLLINRAREFELRPGDPKNGYELSFECIALAGTFMQTLTRLTTMESANESARHAVNAILRKEEFSKEELCQIHDPEEHEPRDLRQLVELDRRLFELGLPHFTEILDMKEVPRSLLRADPDLAELRLGERLQEVSRAR